MKFLASLLISLVVWGGASVSAMENGSHTYFIGDSIGWGMNEYGFLDYDHIDAEIGRKMEQGFDIIDTLDLEAGDRVIIELGTNNLVAPESWYLVWNILALIPDDVRVTWVAPVNFDIPTISFNFYHMLLEIDRPNLDIVPWALVATPHMLHDTLHPSRDGSFVLAALLEPNIQLWL